MKTAKTTGQAQNKAATGRGANAGVATAPRPTVGLSLKADAPVRQYGRGNDANAFWYLKREGELAEVTAEAQNPALGITKIDIFPPTPDQEKYNIVCKVRLHTLCGTDENITIFASDRTAGDIYMRTSGARRVEKDDKVNWYNDRKLNNAAKAQILSHIHQFIEVVQ